MNLSADADVCSLLLRSGRIAAQQRSVTRCTTLSGYSSHPSGSENHCRHWPRFDPARMPISTSGSIPPVGWTLGRSQARPAGALSLPCHEGPARTRVEGAGPPLTNYHRPLNWQSLGGAGGRHFATRQAFVVDSWGHERTSVLRVQFLALVRLFSFPKPSIRHQRKARWRQTRISREVRLAFFPYVSHGQLAPRLVALALSSGTQPAAATKPRQVALLQAGRYPNFTPHSKAIAAVQIVLIDRVLISGCRNQRGIRERSLGATLSSAP